MSQAPPTGNPLADVAVQLGSKMFFDKILGGRKSPQFRKRRVPLGRRMQEYIPELQRYINMQSY